MKPKRVKYIEASGGYLTHGKIYTVLSEGEYHRDGRFCGKTYTIETDSIGKMIYYIEVFEVVGCPCQVSNCIAKHKQ